MAKKKLPDNLTHYVYFDKKSGRILSVGNEKDTRFEHGIRVPFDDVKHFLDDTWKFKDYLVGYSKDLEGNSILTIVPNTDQGYAFKNNIFEWITENDKAECIVTWNKNDKCWSFGLNRDVGEYDELLAPKLVFFVTLENDFDFLVRTIFIDLQELLSSKEIRVPFESNVENKIEKISISSKLVFKSYGLRINND